MEHVSEGGCVTRVRVCRPNTLRGASVSGRGEEFKYAILLVTAAIGQLLLCSSCSLLSFLCLGYLDRAEKWRGGRRAPPTLARLRTRPNVSSVCVLDTQGAESCMHFSATCLARPAERNQFQLIWSCDVYLTGPPACVPHSRCRVSSTHHATGCHDQRCEQPRPFTGGL